MAELQSQAESGEEFYEKIEAPRFVDFTKSDLPCSDDRYWFCSRVGCDQKHEEEMDDEVIYRDFVLRVMAARSPSVGFRRALTRKSPSATVKCTLSAPAKPSKSRLLRLAVISSFSKKTTEAKVKGSTPKPEVKQASVVVKVLTTPRNKNCPRNPVSFQSVRNPKATTIAVSKNRVVAKALVFHSPTKPRQKKASVELSTPVSKICEGMKRLEITSQRKRLLGYSVKSSGDIDPKDASRKKFGTRKVKSRVYDSVNLQNCKRREAKYSRCPKRKSKVADLEKCNGSLPHERDAIDSSDMEIDQKPRDAALSDTSNGGMISNSEENNFSESQSLSEEGTKRSGGSDGVVKTDSSYQSHPEDRYSEQKNMPQIQTQKSDGSKNSGGNDHEEKTKSSLRRRIFLEARPEKVSEELGNSDRIKNKNRKGDQIKQSAEKENDSPSDDRENNSEEMENDEENASASDENRESKSNKDLYERKLLGGRGAGGTTKKVTKLLDNICKENLNSAAAGTQSVKCKPKQPTNPKPFRLRTDERGILKEAKLEERRLHSLAPLKETIAISRFPSATSRRRNEIDIQRNEKCPGQEGTEKDQENQNQPRQIKTACKNSKRKGEPSTITTPQRRTFKYPGEPDFMTPTLESNKEEDVPQSSSRKSKLSSLLQKKLVRSQGIVSSSKAMVSLIKTGQLDVIKETSLTVSCPKVAREPWRSVISATKATSAPRSPSRGRKPHTTIPKEPNFHSIRTPKSCTRKLG